jgi:predicted dehydrogenase
VSSGMPRIMKAAPQQPPVRRSPISRRAMLRGSALAGAALAAGLDIGRAAHAAGNDVLKVGLIGCGSRGTGAAVNAMQAGKDVRLVALADLFPEQLEGCLSQVRQARPDQVAVSRDNCFVGFDAYQKLLATDVQVVLIACTVHFHPTLLAAAIDAGKHVFCEKTHAIDAPGVRRVIESCEKAKQRRLSLVSGLCWRYSPAVRETIHRVWDGAIGEIVGIQATYCVGGRRAYARRPEWTEMQNQMFNWYNFRWLSGDQPSAQLIHCLDIASWALRDAPPASAWGTGGRQVCVEPRFGDLFDHHAIVHEYSNGIRLYGFCRDQPGCYDEYSVVLLGTNGRAMMPHRCWIEGRNAWRYKGIAGNMYDLEHQSLFDAVRKGSPINSGSYMATSSMLAILGQMVCCTGQRLTWEQAMQSTREFRLPRYAWDVEPPVHPDKNGQYPTAMPGITTS